MGEEDEILGSCSRASSGGDQADRREAWRARQDERRVRGGRGKTVRIKHDMHEIHIAYHVKYILHVKHMRLNMFSRFGLQSYNAGQVWPPVEHSGIRLSQTCGPSCGKEPGILIPNEPMAKVLVSRHHQNASLESRDSSTV